MRRYFPTLVILFLVLALGGYTIYQNFGGASPEESPYVPTFSTDPQTAQMQAGIVVGGGVGLLVLVIGMAGGLAFAFSKISEADATSTAAAAAAAKANPPAKPAPAPKPAPGAAPAKPEAPQYFLASSRAQSIFLVGVGVFIAAYLTVTSWGKVIGYIPAFNADFLTGVTELQAFIGVVVALVVLVPAMSFGLARAFEVAGPLADAKPDAFPRTPVDDMIKDLDRRLKGEAAPASEQGHPPVFVDRLLTALDVVMVIVILGLIGSWLATPSARPVVEIKPTAPPVSPALEAEFKALPAGDAKVGEAVFNGAGACMACHSLEAGVTLVGPPAAGVAGRAGSRKAGYSAEIYLYESIISPNAFVVSGFPNPSPMPATFKDTLKPEEISGLIAYLMTKN